jgi:Na+-translocating ferredoxin:NAD+ oxidoreductase RnfG subunit
MSTLSKLIFFGFILFSILMCSIKEDTENIIKDYFAQNVTLEFQKFTIPSPIKNEVEKKVKQSFFNENVYCWYITKNDSLVSIAMLDNAIGKVMPITFLVIFDMAGMIEHTEIIKYRESYGGEIQSKKWNSQFIGMRKSSTFDNVDGISGATISVNSVSKGIHKLVLLFPEILKLFKAK